jgi:YVTN family beta-propeller protein
VGIDPVGVAVNPVTSRLYVSDIIQNLVYVIDTHSNQIITSIPVPGNPAQMGINIRLNRIYVSEFGNGSTVAVIDGNTNTVMASIPVPLPQNFAINPVNNRVYISNNNFFGAVTVVDGNTNTVIAQISTAGQFTIGVGVDFIRNLIYAADETGILNVIDGKTNTLVAQITLGSELVGLSVNPFTNRIYVSDFSARQIDIVDGESRQEIGVLSDAGGPEQTAIDLIHERLFVTNSADSVTVINSRP